MRSGCDTTALPIYGAFALPKETLDPPKMVDRPPHQGEPWGANLGSGGEPWGANLGGRTPGSEPRGAKGGEPRGRTYAPKIIPKASWIDPKIIPK